MIDLSDLRAFARIAELGSISSSARALNAPKSSVSRSLARLEAVLGSVLVERSTRHLRLTDAGRLFFPHAQRILGDVEEAEAALGSLAGVPRGTLRVKAPYSFTLGALAPMLPAFLSRYPDVHVVLEMENSRTEMMDGEPDLIVRVGPLPDSTMIARRLVTIQLWTCASPAYVARRSAPSRIAELAGHDIVGAVDRTITWSFHGGDDRLEEVRLEPRTVVPDAALMRVVLAGGGGIGQLPDFMAAEAIGKGELVRILPQLRPDTIDVHALYPSHRSLSSKVRVFIDSLVMATLAQRAAFTRPPR